MFIAWLVKYELCSTADWEGAGNGVAKENTHVMCFTTREFSSLLILLLYLSSTRRAARLALRRGAREKFADVQSRVSPAEHCWEMPAGATLFRTPKSMTFRILFAIP